MNTEQLAEVELLFWCYTVAAILLAIAVTPLMTVKGMISDHR